MGNKPNDTTCVDNWPSSAFAQSEMINFAAFFISIPILFCSRTESALVFLNELKIELSSKPQLYWP